MNILEEIGQYKLKEVAERKKLYPVKSLEKSALYKRTPVSLSKYLKRNDLQGIIAEFKRKSPSKGIINANANPADTTRGYVQAGASALSVLTDEKYFNGSSEDLIAARNVNTCPILRKDFTIDEYQVIEARSLGADVILLIAELLDKHQIKTLARLAESSGMEVLLEINSVEQLEKVNDHIHLVGVNNRNLKTFEVNVDNALQIASAIPPKFEKIAESGIYDAHTIMKLKKAGFSGFLIGEFFMRQQDPAAACAALIANLKQLQKTSSV